MNVAKATKSNIGADFGFTNRAINGLVRANTSNVQQIRLITQQLLNTANRRSSVNTKLASSKLGNITARTTMPKTKKPSYFS